MFAHGFLRLAAAVPPLRVAEPLYNAQQTCQLLRQAQTQQVDVIVFPEVGLTGYTCNDLFHQQALLRAAVEALQVVVQATAESFQGLAVVGLPLVVDEQLFNCAAVIHRGRLLGIVPKSYLPNYQEFYDARFFAPAWTAHSRSVRWGDAEVPFGVDLLFRDRQQPTICVGVEICEDLWMPIPPSSWQALHGATVLLNLSASNETIGKAAYRRELVNQQSARCIAAYAYASSGTGESTTDLVFGGHCLIAENGVLLAESSRFSRQATLLTADVDIDRLVTHRMQTTSFHDALAEPHGRAMGFRIVEFALETHPQRPLRRHVDAHPFVPKAAEQLRERCEEIFQTQVCGLARRLEHLGTPSVAIGVSGGLDSTLALLVTCKAFDTLAAPRSAIQALTMPGFGTTQRTRTNAEALMRLLGVRAKTIDIRPLCLAEWRALGHAPFGIDLHGLDVEQFSELLRQLPPERRSDLVFENVQARMRTQLLMNTGFVIGTGDLSELALGWCTYNGDHMSMYNPNASIPKTLVKFLVGWAAENEFTGEVRSTLLDIVGTEISPELLPTSAEGKIVQATESAIGPYELHDFFLYHLLRYGAPPAKIVYLATQAEFRSRYTVAEIIHWLRVLLTRMFRNQFKRSCVPDGPKVGSVSLSPRGDWRMPSDASVQAWLADLDRLQDASATPEG